MQRKKLDIGNSDFRSLIINDNYYVDKSLLIAEVLNVEKQVLLFPRPRRFGKTTNLSMLRCFFDKNMPENKSLFSDLQISENEQLVEKHCCKYPVIYLSFKDAKANSWEESAELLKHEIKNAYKQHHYLLESNAISDLEKNYINELLWEKIPNSKYSFSLRNLSEFLYKHHNQKVVVLIDEYDTPIQSGYSKYYNEVVSFMRNLLSGALKDNSYLYKGVITGILRVSKESIFSGLNNIAVFSVFNHDFADKFGFTKEEVEQILLDFNLMHQYEGVKKWYNGYKFGRTENIYNPWSILNYITRTSEGFQPFWTQTSSNDLIKQEIRNKESEHIRQDILQLLEGKSLTQNVEHNFVFPELQTNKELVWSLLTYSGYLTASHQVKRNAYRLKIPNFEIRTVFMDTILSWFQTDVRIRHNQLYETARFLVSNQINRFAKGFKTIMGDTFSYYDTAQMNEYVFHAYLLGLLAIIGDDYIVKSNRESGKGRYDIMLIPKPEKDLIFKPDYDQHGVVIEIKQTKTQQKNETDEQFKTRINNLLQTAKHQIETQKYYNELIEHNIPTQKIIKLPIVFAGKEAFFEENEE